MANGIQNWGWRDYEGDFNQDILYNTQRRAGDTAGALLDFGSPFYQQFGNYLNKTIPGVGAGSYLSTLQAGGGNYGGSMAQTLALKANADKQRRDSINAGILGFASQNVGTAANLLGTQGQIGSNILQGQLQREQTKSQEGGLLDFAGSILGTAAGVGLAGLTGGASIPMGMTFGSGLGGGTGYPGQGMNYNPFSGGYFKK